MSDANLVRVLGRQMRSPVGLVELATIEAGPRAVASKVRRPRRRRLPGCHCRRVVRSSSRCGRRSERRVAADDRRRGLRRRPRARELPRRVSRGRMIAACRVRAPIAMLSGSCSATTLAQIEQAAGLVPTREIDPMKIAENPDELPRLIDWACDQVAAGSVLLYSSGEPGKVQSVQQRLGHDVGRGSRREDLRLARGGTGRPGCQNVRRCRRGDVGSRPAGSGHTRAHLRRRARPRCALGAEPGA